ncbi:MAG: TIGR03086 family metal-binding protein [Gordonia amarae]
MTEPIDPRPVFAAASAWAADLMQNVTDDMLTRPTPCAEFDVKTLCAHLIATAQRAAGLADGIDILTINAIADTWHVADYTATVRRTLDLWSDDQKLTETVVVPWGTVPGAGALWGYVNEALVHGWDLAVATGQDPEADPAIVAPALAVAQQFIPAEIREIPDLPFAPVVPPREEAGLTEQLANWTGRQSRSWVLQSGIVS